MHVALHFSFSHCLLFFVFHVCPKINISVYVDQRLSIDTQQQKMTDRSEILILHFLVKSPCGIMV